MIIFLTEVGLIIASIYPYILLTVHGLIIFIGTYLKHKFDKLKYCLIVDMDYF